MGVRSALARLGASATVPVFVAAGSGVGEAIGNLHLDPRLRIVAAPRQANLLLLAGGVSEPLLAAAMAAHDAIPPPRGVVTWRMEPDDPALSHFPHAVHAPQDEAGPTLVATHRALVLGERRSSPPVREGLALDDAPTTPVVPRLREPARDGLALDRLTVAVGPLFTGFPDGLVARVTFVGDMVQRFELGTNPFEPGSADDGEPFLRALHEPVPVADLEVARARSLLRAVAFDLRLHGLAGLAERTLALTLRRRAPDAAEITTLRRLLTRRWVTGAQLRRVGVLAANEVAGLGLGPLTRALGLAEDLRSDDPAYRAAGFTPVLGSGADAAGRLRQRLLEAEQSLVLAASSGGAVTLPTGAVEGPRGRLTAGSSPTARLLPLVPRLVEGTGWQDAVATLASLDLDLREAAAVSVTTEPRR